MGGGEGVKKKGAGVMETGFEGFLQRKKCFTS